MWESQFINPYIMRFEPATFCDEKEGQDQDDEDGHEGNDEGDDADEGEEREQQREGEEDAADQRAAVGARAAAELTVPGEEFDDPAVELSTKFRENVYNSTHNA